MNDLFRFSPFSFGRIEVFGLSAGSEYRLQAARRALFVTRIRGLVFKR